MVYVPTDIPEAGQPGYQKAVEAALVDLLRAMNGRTLVPSRPIRSCRQTYRAISRPLEEATLSSSLQNLTAAPPGLGDVQEQERPRCLARARFGEGIDVAGEALSWSRDCAAAVLWFQAIRSFRARSETSTIRSPQYGGARSGVGVFRQGFGRLIRTKNDRGIVSCRQARAIEELRAIFYGMLPPGIEISGTAEKANPVCDKVDQWQRVETLACNVSSALTIYAPG